MHYTVSHSTHSVTLQACWKWVWRATMRSLRRLTDWHSQETMAWSWWTGRCTSEEYLTVFTYPGKFLYLCIWFVFISLPQECFTYKMLASIVVGGNQAVLWGKPTPIHGFSQDLSWTWTLIVERLLGANTESQKEPTQINIKLDIVVATCLQSVSAHTCTRVSMWWYCHYCSSANINR